MVRSITVLGSSVRLASRQVTSGRQSAPETFATPRFLSARPGARAPIRWTHPVARCVQARASSAIRWAFQACSRRFRSGAELPLDTRALVSSTKMTAEANSSRSGNAGTGDLASAGTQAGAILGGYGRSCVLGLTGGAADTFGGVGLLQRGGVARQSEFRAAVKPPTGPNLFATSVCGRDIFEGCRLIPRNF